VMLAGTWPAADYGEGDVGAQAERLRALVTRACDAAMPQVNPCPRRAAYWWSEEIAELHRSAHVKRRALKRARRRRGTNPAEAERAAVDYRGASKALRSAIAAAKARAWGELLLQLDENPWGRPYQIVRQKLRRWVPPHTESLEASLLNNILGTLFPEADGQESVWEEESPTEGEWSKDLEVSEEELAGVVKRMRGKNTAPGPNGIPGKVWALAMKYANGATRHLFNRCLKEGCFPPVWRRAKLVLLRKENKPADVPSGYRPICLLDEEAKLLERVIAGRLVRHLEEVGPDLHGQQFGFRRARSTVDAILCVRGLVETAVREGGVAVGVSLDISNAFNTLPWDRIGRALRHHGVPPYLRRVLRAYLSDQWLEYRDSNQVPVQRGVYRGVPQGSVLGPHLWNLGYNAVLEEVLLPPGCDVVCYADDTLILAAGRDWGEARSRANEATAGVVRHIRSLGLEVAPQKTEAIYFHNGLRGVPQQDSIEVSGVPVPIGAHIKYLGLVLDSKWTFRTHFDKMVPRVAKAADSLARLLPNLGGPNGRVRRLYAEVVNSIVLYAAPVWAAEVSASRRICTQLWGVQRRVAIRAIRAYRTTSHAAATVLAGQPPLELLASMRQEVYFGLAELRRANGGDTPPRQSRQSDKGPGAATPRGRLVGLAMPTERGHEEGRRSCPAPPGRLAGTGMGRALFPSDAGNNRPRLLRGLPVSHREGAHHAMPPLRLAGGLGATHSGGLPCLGGPASGPRRSGWRRPLAPGGNIRHAREREVMEGPPRVLRGGPRDQGGGGEGPAGRGHGRRALGRWKWGRRAPIQTASPPPGPPKAAMTGEGGEGPSLGGWGSSYPAPAMGFLPPPGGA